MGRGPDGGIYDEASESEDRSSATHSFGSVDRCPARRAAMRVSASCA